MNRDVNWLKDRLEWGAFAGLVVWFYGAVTLVRLYQHARAAIRNARGGSPRPR